MTFARSMEINRGRTIVDWYQRTSPKGIMEEFGTMIGWIFDPEPNQRRLVPAAFITLNLN